MSEMTIAFSVEKRRPGCVLLQAAMGGHLPPGRFLSLFPTETWLLAPTDDMRTYRVTEGQLEQLSAMALDAVREPPKKRQRRRKAKRVRKA